MDALSFGFGCCVIALQMNFLLCAQAHIISVTHSLWMCVFLNLHELIIFKINEFNSFPNASSYTELEERNGGRTTAVIWNDDIIRLST